MADDLRYSSNPLDRTTVGGKSAYKLRDWTQDVLMRRDSPDAPWEPVDKLEKPIDDDELTQFDGMWHDREVTSGHLWWKKVIRPADGQIQPDEVTPMAEWKRSQAIGNAAVTAYTLQKVSVESHASSTGQPFFSLDGEWKVF